MFHNKKLTPIKIDPNQKTPDQQPKSLLDEFATWATARWQKPLCNKLSAEFNTLQQRSVDSDGRPKTVQAWQVLKSLETQVDTFKTMIESGGVAGAKAMIDAGRFIRDMHTHKLDPVG